MEETGLDEILQQARRVQGAPLEALLHHRSREVLEALLENPHLREPHLLILLARKDLARDIVGRVAQNQDWMKSRSLKLAVLKHPKVPRPAALRLLKLVYPFDLLEIGLTPGVAPDLKRLVEDTLLAQCERLVIGQRLTLARRGSTRIAAGLLQDSDPRVIRAALDNPALTEQAVSSALVVETAPSELPQAVLQHPRWITRRLVRLALLRNRHLSLARFAALLPEIPRADLNDLVEDPRLDPRLRSYVAKMLRSQGTGSGRRGV
ncbi:MAG TPA: hypothetical protein VNN17_07610 [Terriglobia bacterium]|nr:hypothetical protein [Terriglobia bacterium]